MRPNTPSFGTLPKGSWRRTTLTYAIQKQPLQVEVGNRGKLYGSADPAYSYTVKDAGGTAVAGIRLTGAVERTAGENVGQYPLNIGNLSAGSNYVLTLSGAPALRIDSKSIGDGITPAGNISPQAPSYVAADNTTGGQLKQALQVTYWAPALGQKTLAAGTDYSVTIT